MADESKTETIHIRCTEREKAAFRFLSSARGISESELGRRVLVGDALIQFEDALKVLGADAHAEPKPAA